MPLGSAFSNNLNIVFNKWQLFYFICCIVSNIVSMVSVQIDTMSKPAVVCSFNGTNCPAFLNSSSSPTSKSQSVPRSYFSQPQKSARALIPPLPTLLFCSFFFFPMVYNSCCITYFSCLCVLPVHVIVSCMRTVLCFLHWYIPHCGP
jgi:hypothetical protein